MTHQYQPAFAPVQRNGKPDAFTIAYLEAAEWCDVNQEAREYEDDESYPRTKAGKPVKVRGWSAQAKAQAIADCAAFQRDHAADLAICYTGAHSNGNDYDESSAGHDLWLTRNGHGAGFWDRFSADAPQADAAERLSEACRALRERNAYVGDNGYIYFM